MAWSNITAEDIGRRVEVPGYGMGKIFGTTGNGESIITLDNGNNVTGMIFNYVDEPAEPGGNPQQGFAKGDKVRHKVARTEGKVTRVTKDGTVNVKFKGDEYVSVYTKDDAFNEIEKVEKSEEEKQQEAEKEQERQKEREERDSEQKSQDAADDLYGLLNLKDKLEQKIEKEVDDELRQLRDLAKRNQKLEINIDEKIQVIEGLRHKQLEQLIKYATLRLSPLLVGMAGTGKTHAGEQTAEALGLPFYSISVGAQTTKTDIMGYMDASGRYIKTHFRDAYENGGVFLMDEIDAGNANVLITINAALSNGLCAFPDKMVKKHEDFVFIASANTFGNGANRQYVGRNQLDAATLDRFALINWDIDDELEQSLSSGEQGEKWYNAVKKARDYVAEKNIRALISPRATQKGSKLLEQGIPVEEVVEATLLGSVPEDKKEDVRKETLEAFEGTTPTPS